MKLLVGYDGSKCSIDALEDLALAGLPAAGEATVLSVGELWLPPPSTFAVVETGASTGAGIIVTEARSVAADGRDRLQALLPKWEVHGDACGGSPARILLEREQSLKPDLVVLGSHGRTGLSRVIVGSVSNKVAAEASGAVRIGRKRLDRSAGPARLLIGIDGSAGALAALRTVARRAWPEGGHAMLVTAVGPADDNALRAELDRVRAMHADMVDQLARVGLNVSSTIERADPRQLLVDIAARFEADTIVLGAVGELTLNRFLFGTVVAAVMSRAACSVEVVRERL